MIPSVTSLQPQFEMIPILLLVAMYAFFAYCLILIAKKTGNDQNTWWAWVPILQVLLILKIAGVQWWWIFLFLVPLVNIAVAIYIWVKISKSLSKHAIWGVLMIVPFFDLFVLAYLAFSKTTPPPASAS
jgi:hypothetical protein